MSGIVRVEVVRAIEKGAVMEEQAQTQDVDTTEVDELIDDESLMEEVSIDGMCGVY
ncbi:mycofactocin precursor MftA [Streptomyces sp. NBC_00988]|uniref:mycofactocin precursor MftA n=1 Tax=Streptomyces sp. NBC_00988 TaxID=2903704 RepID=UPI003867B727|nr:mycofactocin precursor MftA [Streptomyces sp. NBC_00988]